jgi:hypothetical protein
LPIFQVNVVSVINYVLLVVVRSQIAHYVIHLYIYLKISAEKDVQIKHTKQ